MIDPRQRAGGANCTLKGIQGTACLRTRSSTLHIYALLYSCGGAAKK